MSIIRINSFHAKTGSGDALRDLLRATVPPIVAKAGCLSCQVIQHVEEPERIVVIERWETIAAHQAAAQQIPVHAFERVMQLLARRPEGEYFREA